ncbi:unnamed protein product [Rotaria sordida]|uniref:G-protein coupled receptors family 1 profile domain-containing protein n=1 Tax=Rotaria sordida TaxID=392033 RepID=A0A819CX45_9BILA|nr:unnamed protein product [Rotaria sordida]CAF3826181.1 unnamed protein product [Rotaria sordida]CAF3917131.1 unnamed protein product [Rotaria sordida]
MWHDIIRLGLVRIFYPCLMIFGTIGNILCLKILLRKRFRRQSTCQYLCIVAVIDILFIYMRSTRYLYRYIFHGDLRNTSLWICRSYIFFSSTLSHLASWILVIVNFDRYFIMKNFFPYRHAGWRVIKSTCVLIFIICLVNTHYFYILGVNKDLNISSIHKYKNSSNETYILTTRFVCMARPEFQKFFSLYLPIFDLLSVAIIPLLLMIFTNIGIIRITQRTSLFLTSRKQKRNNRLTIMLLSVTLAFMLLTCPSVIYICINRLIPSTSVSDTKLVIIDLLESLWYTKHALNFILYTLSGQDFRREFRKLISCSKRTTSSTLQYQRRQQQKENNLVSMTTYNSFRQSSSTNIRLHKLKKKRQYYNGNNQLSMTYSNTIQDKIIDDGESTLGGECGLYSASSNVILPTVPWWT